MAYNLIFSCVVYSVSSLIKSPLFHVFTYQIVSVSRHLGSHRFHVESFLVRGLSDHLHSRSCHFFPRLSFSCRVRSIPYQVTSELFHSVSFPKHNSEPQLPHRYTFSPRNSHSSSSSWPQNGHFFFSSISLPQNSTDMAAIRLLSSSAPIYLIVTAGLE